MQELEETTNLKQSIQQAIERITEQSLAGNLELTLWYPNTMNDPAALKEIIIKTK